MVGGQRTLGMGRPTRTVTAILVLMGAVFLLEIISFNFLGLPKLIAYLALTPQVAVTKFWLWQPFTYVFVHDPQNFMHILFNGLLLWWFASPVEREVGQARFIRLFVFATAVTGAAVIATGAVLAWLDLQVPTLGRTHWVSPTLGMSGVALSFFTAWALRNREQTILFMFVLPMRAMTMLYISLGIELLLILTLQAQAWPAHLSGMAFGAVWATAPRWALRERFELWRLRRAKKARRHLVLVTPAEEGAGEDAGRGSGDRRYLN